MVDGGESITGGWNVSIGDNEEVVELIGRSIWDWRGLWVDLGGVGVREELWTDLGRGGVGVWRFLLLDNDKDWFDCTCWDKIEDWSKQSIFNNFYY